MSTANPSFLDLAKSGKYDEIDTLLDDSSSLDEKAKVEMLLMKYTNGWSLFQDICTKPQVPLYLVTKVLQILGKSISDASCRGCLEQILKVPIKERCVNDKVRIIEVILDQLKGNECIDLKAHLLAVAILHNPTKKDMRTFLQVEGKELVSKKHMIAVTHCNTTKQTVNVELIKPEVETENPKAENFMIVEASVLEIALHSHVSLDIIRYFLNIGGKELIVKSKRSLLQGVLLEYNKSIAVDIFQMVLEKSGKERKDIVMNMTSWNEQILENMGIFQFLNFKKNFLQDEPMDDKKKKDGNKKKEDINKRVLTFDDMKKIMNMLLDAQEKSSILTSYGSSGSILHTFDYYDHQKFTGIVNRIVSVGGKELLSIRNDEGYNFLHYLIASNKTILKGYWHILTINKRFVTLHNKDMETALHVACRLNRADCIDALLKKGEVDIIKVRDKDGNTALHLLSATDASALSIFQKLIAIGGKQLLDTKNYANELPLNQFEDEKVLDEISLQQQKERINEEPVSKNSQKKAKKSAKKSAKERLQADYNSLKKNFDEQKIYIAMLEDAKQKDMKELKKAKADYKSLEDAKQKDVKELKEAKADYKSLQRNFDEQKIYIAMLEDKNQKDEALFSESAEKVKQLEEENAKPHRSLIGCTSASEKHIETTPNRKRPRNELDCNECNARSPKSPFRKFTSKVSSMFHRQEENDIEVIDHQYETESKVLRAQISSLQSENEDLLNQLEEEKTNHTKTLQRLKDARDEMMHIA
ncbi:predicted protein [Chaetoceros tenuissimus]|uniref:Uncharacterized protein n=1 Tax=Chaetoceros tenuissimus TaxID=426638 RepID=A0AAD3CE49_9STRA|nr:predicted protein [Chaetoceros tenuissimus]